MKKILSVLAILLLSAGFLFAQEESADEYDDGYVYESNGTGDQLLKIGLLPLFPLNFGDQIGVGGAAELGYYRFLTKNLAVGGEVSVSFNITKGSNSLAMLPFSFGVMYQPSFGKIEIPLTAGVGFGFESAQNSAYFPSFVLNVDAGAFYRYSEMWSFGAEGKFLWIPQWFKDPSLNKNGLFAALVLCARYHF